MKSKENPFICRILLIIILYLLQGYIQGFMSSIPLYLSSYKASWQEQSIFSWAFYPFSFKILWAPILDSIYSYRFGRYVTWLIPIQIIIASQDIVVDGWSILLFTSSNPQWASTCQTIGQVIGYFLGSTILMTFESSNFMNKYIRKPLSLPQRSSGLFSLQQFTFSGGIGFIFVSLIISLTFFFNQPSNKTMNINKQKKMHTKLDLFETYSSILKLFQKQCMRELALILITFDIGFAATNYMTVLTLSEYGITRDTIALLNIPSIVIHILVPLCMSRIRHPLIWFAYGYIPRLISAVIVVIYIYFIPQILHTWYFYPTLILLFCLNQTVLYIMIVSRVGFSTRISEPQIAGTYMTLLATISNLGQSLLSTLVFYIANWLPKTDAYFIEVGGCVLLGLIWIKFFWHTLMHLDTLPVEEWYLKPSADVDIIIDYEPTTTVKYN
ncbi:unnamed protein product [Rotaria sordida]|uniref:Uncharacterized protein n=1 Tax=Rotaria sordida TaxID=392033 RepID=A0A814QY17_9BILA|nr:unnamed protein product [Rotaria sordida]CAF1348227.1 unnamed protein product [Rotaria sordida]